MGQVNDDTVIVTVTPGYQTGLLAYYQANGATSNDLRQAEYEFLLTQGAIAAHKQDMWFAFLTGKGFVGSLSDMLQQFWAGGGSVTPPFTLEAVRMDGTNDYSARGADLDGLVDSRVGIVSFWFRSKSLANGQQILSNNTNKFLIHHNYGGYIEVQLWNTSAGLALNPLTTGAVAIDTWHHILLAWDIINGDSKMFLNDTQVFTSASTGSLDIDLTAADWSVGARATPGQYYNGCLSNLYANFAETLDLSVVANRRLFDDGAGVPVGLGGDGSLVTGNQPEIYFNGDSANWGTNLGSGGNFTVFGAPVDCATVPV
jgi:hypothetical protein